MKKIFFFCLLSSLFIVDSFAQGCIPIRSTGSNAFDRQIFDSKNKLSKWTLSATNRYFKSFRHFVGDIEQKQRAAEGTEVINHNYTLDLNLTRIWNKRWSTALNIPVVANTRSSLYEHNGVRHSTEASGLGDIRLTAYRWLLDPSKFKKINIQAGLGIKFPTGNFKAKDYFYTGPAAKVLGPVDQSIQLGDGGTGIITELNSFYNASRRWSIYTNLYYLSNPRATNGVSTARGQTSSAASIAYGSNVMSVPDQYMARMGATMTIKRFSVSAGARIDGVPANDLIGSSNGFRRPGYVIAVDPGISYRSRRLTLFLNTPVALERNRIQSVPDKKRTEITGKYYKGDAAFADYVVNLGIALRFPSISKYKKADSNKRLYNGIPYRPYSGCRKSYGGCQKKRAVQL
jgi:hypothetical protein